MKIGDKPEFKHNITAEFEDGNLFTTQEKVIIRTKVLNKTYGLTNSQAICFSVNPPFTSDGASIPALFRWLIPRKAKWILVAGVAHDWIWGEGFIDAYILDIHTGIITDYLGKTDVSFAEGNKIMLEKMNSYYAPFFLMYLVYWTLELVRIIKGK